MQDEKGPAQRGLSVEVVMKRFCYLAGMGAQLFLYVGAGINHFWHTGMYLRIMPPHYSDPLMLVRLSGVAEILGGIGLVVPATRRPAATGLIVLLVVYFDVHLYMARNAAQFTQIPAWAIYARVPLQFVLIAWAWVYARSEQPMLAKTA